MVSCMGDVPWKLYSSRVISAWGDRMWMFAVGLFMVSLDFFLNQYALREVSYNERSVIFFTGGIVPGISEMASRLRANSIIIRRRFGISNWSLG